MQGLVDFFIGTMIDSYTRRWRMRSIWCEVVPRYETHTDVENSCLTLLLEVGGVREILSAGKPFYSFPTQAITSLDIKRAILIKTLPFSRGEVSRRNAYLLNFQNWFVMQSHVWLVQTIDTRHRLNSILCSWYQTITSQNTAHAL